MRALVRGRDVAADLARVLASATEERKDRHGFIAVLHQQSGVIDRTAVDARRRAGLEASDTQRQCAQAFRETVRRRIAGASARRLLESDVDLAAEKRADRKHDRTRRELEAHGSDDAGNAAVLDRGVGDLGLEQRQVRLVLDDRADRLLVERTVGLRARRANGRTFARIERAELDAGPVDGTRHRATQRIDLTDEVALADAADRRVAAHLAQRLDALRDEQRARAASRRGERGFGAGMAATDHDHVEIFGEASHRLPSG